MERASVEKADWYSVLFSPWRIMYVLYSRLYTTAKACSLVQKVNEVFDVFGERTYDDDGNIKKKRKRKK